MAHDKVICNVISTQRSQCVILAEMNQLNVQRKEITEWGRFKQRCRDGQKRDACKGISKNIIIPVFIIFTDAFILVFVICFAVSFTVLAEQDNTIQVEPLPNTELVSYGIQTGEINGLTHGEIIIKTDGDVQSDVTIVLSENAPTIPGNDSISQSLSSGPDINEVYVHNNFTYIANITAEPGVSFTVTITRSDKYGNNHLYHRNITIGDSSTVFINYSSNESGYYSVTYEVFNETNGTKTGLIYYNEIDTNELQRKRKKCTIQPLTSECHISVEFQSSKYFVIVLVSRFEMHSLAITFKGR